MNLRLVLGSVALLSAGAIRADVMPSFANVPTGWSTDRYAPNSFSDIGFYQGRDNVLGIGISSADSLSNRPAPYKSTFYNTQGKGHAIAAGAGSEIDADLYIPTSWGNAGNGSVRTDMWGVMADGSNNVTDYPIIGFTNYGGAARYRVWIEDMGGWVDVATPVAYDSWTSFGIKYDGTAIDYLIDGVQVYSYAEDESTEGFQRTIMQAYNFGGDPSIAGANPVDYTAHWSNTPVVPEPGSLLLLGTVILGLTAGMRKSQQANKH